MQAVPDTNVLVSAAATPGGVCEGLLRRLAQSPIEIVLSPLLLSEVERVLGRRRFSWIGAASRAAFLEYLRRSSRLEDDLPASGDPLVPLDPGDDYLIRLTLAVPERILVSGDPHLLALAGRYPVVSPRELLDRLIAAEDV